jgi:hypothetical protein
LAYQISYGLDNLDCVSGAVYDVAGLPPSSFVNRMPLTLRTGTRIFEALSPTLMVANTYFSIEFSDNRIEATPRGIRATRGIGDGFERLNKNVLSELAAIWRRLGAFRCPAPTWPSREQMRTSP